VSVVLFPTDAAACSIINYLLKGGGGFAAVSVCLFVCVCEQNISQNVVDGLERKFLGLIALYTILWVCIFSFFNVLY